MAGLKQALPRRANTKTYCGTPGANLKRNPGFLRLGCETPCGVTLQFIPCIWREYYLHNPLPECLNTPVATPPPHSYWVTRHTRGISQLSDMLDRYRGCLSRRNVELHYHKSAIDATSPLQQLVWRPWHSSLLCIITAEVSRGCEQEHWSYHATLHHCPCALYIIPNSFPVVNPNLES